MKCTMYNRAYVYSFVCTYVALSILGGAFCRIPKCGKVPDGLYPDHFTCLKYYRCLQGRTYRETCPPGTVFNPSSRTCDFLRNVPTCQGFSPSQVGTCSGKQDGFYYNPENCHSYYRCKDGNQWFYTCPRGTIFDPVSEVCNHPFQVKSDCKYMYKGRNK